MGKTIICGLIIRTYKDYPRLRGKDFSLQQSNGYNLRIAPADAGKTTAKNKYGKEYRDHPRSRGKDSYP